MTHWELCHREKSSGLRARKPERRPRSAPEPLSHVGGRLSSPPRTWHPLASQECHRPRWPQTGHAGPESRWPSCAWRREPRRAGSRVFPGSLSLARRSPNLRAHPWVSPLSPPISKEPEVASRPRPGSRCPPPPSPPPPPRPRLPWRRPFQRQPRAPPVRLPFWSLFRFLRRVAVISFLLLARGPTRSSLFLSSFVPSGAKSGADRRPCRAPAPPRPRRARPAPRPHA